jgi:hypothetical protein
MSRSLILSLSLAVSAALLVPADTTAQAPMPDLVVDQARLQSSVEFRTKSYRGNTCAIQEGCLSGVGKRKLMLFDTLIVNVGTADHYLGSPRNNPLFEYSPCHRHYHFDGYASYEVLTPDGAVVVTGRKQAFCAMDSLRVSPTASTTAKYTCSNQGIQVGWGDLYYKGLDCQWLDVTGLSGPHKLRVVVNPQQLFLESNYGNNTAVVDVNIP